MAIDESTRENGCLKIVKDSHLLGTLPHDSWSETLSDNGVKPIKKLFR
ncbi:hypothetical protein [Moorena sp. SIO3H5]|nr:phytanoyl-CoA dioxygenase family protein [Moorena sp. SIO3E8]NEQ02889.1 phytanoyl-CoA dioxygenase family protein [Moorena sp. SIO3F7]